MPWHLGPGIVRNFGTGKNWNSSEIAKIIGKLASEIHQQAELKTSSLPLGLRLSFGDTREPEALELLLSELHFAIKALHHEPGDSNNFKINFTWRWRAPDR